jgi:hypothetical protein
MKFLRTRIAYDDQPESPRDWSNVGTFVGFEHRSYSIGDRRPTEIEMRLLYRGGTRMLLRWLKRTEGATKVMLVGMIDHSGVSYYIGGGTAPGDAQGWDSGTCGFIYDTAAGRAETGVEPGTHEGDIQVGYMRGKVRGTIDNIEAALTQEIESYDQWASGQVYAYCVEERTLCPQCEELIKTEFGCDFCPNTKEAHATITDHEYTPLYESLPDECPHCDIEDGWCGGNYAEDGIDGWDLPDYAKAQMQDELDKGNIESDYSRRITAPWKELKEGASAA